MQSIQERINLFYDQWQYYYYPDREQKCKPTIQQYLSQIEGLLEGLDDSKKKEKAKLFYLKGKILDILPYYEKSAEQQLNKSIKLNPINGDCWNTLAHVLFKKKDYKGAKNAIEMALENKGKNKVSLRYQSVLLRSQEADKHSIEQSVKIIKDALLLDIKDGGTWYFLGNAYLTNFFVNYKKFDELQNAIKAYNEAEKYLKYKYPDLYLNRGNVEAYMEQYQHAIKDLKQAGDIDKSIPVNQRIQTIIKRMQFTQSSFDRLNQIKKTKIQQLIKNIPNSINNKQKVQIVPITKLKQRLNPQKIISLKILLRLSKTNDIPTSFLVIDSQGNFLCLSIYNTTQKINQRIQKDTLITVIDPQLKKITYNSFTYNCIQVFEIMKLFINGKHITKEQFNPNYVYNETFEK